MNKILTLVIIFLSVINVFPQQKTIKVIPGEQFQIGWFSEIFLGEHYRDDWALPIEVEIIDLNKFGGGITPLKMGGGFQTKSLRFTGSDGHIWKFRMMEKDPSKTLPEYLRKTVAGDVLKDQISSAYPLAPIVISPILDSLKVLNSKPYLVYMPDSPILGEFRETFKNSLGFMEIHPDVEEEEGIGYYGAEDIKSTLKLFERLEEKKDEKVSQTEYLKARLIDLVCGDWDRHADQWKWAKYTKNNQTLWVPIPRDRDQTFSLFDGQLVTLAEYVIPQFNHFGDSYNHIEDQSWNGRFVDRRFLTELTKTQWDSVTSYVYSNFNDELIETSVKELPEQHFELRGEEIIYKLKERRNQIAEISQEYYEFINTTIDLYASTLKDSVYINRISDEQTIIKLFNKKKKKHNYKPYFTKIVENELCDEVRLYLLDDDDIVNIEGDVDSSPLIRVIGGDGKDEVIDNGNVDGYLFSILPIKNAETKTIVYDSGKKTDVSKGTGTWLNKNKVKIPDEPEQKYRPVQRDRSSNSLFFPLLGYNTDDGLLIGAGELYEKFGFRKSPYDYQIITSALYATKPNEFHVNFDFIKYFSVPGLSYEFFVEFSTLRFTKYYGYGNNTPFSSDLLDSDYYDASSHELDIVGAIFYDSKKYGVVGLGGGFIISDFHLNTNSLLESFPEQEYGLDDFTYGAILGSYIYDSRDIKGNPSTGIYLELSSELNPKIFDNKHSFFSGDFDFRIFNTVNIITPITLALRAGGGRTWGKYPFFKAQFLGGSENLRGYTRERFSGDSKLFGQSELRIQLLSTKIVLPVTINSFGFIESGRVFQDGGGSKKWHPSYGGGLTFEYLEKEMNISIAYATSPEDSYVWLGFATMF